MKQKDLIFLGGAALLAYYLYNKNKNQNIAAGGGPGFNDILGQLGNMLNYPLSVGGQVAGQAANALGGVITSESAVKSGGGVVQAVKSVFTAPDTYAPGVQQVAANIDYLRAATLSGVAQVSNTPTGGLSILPTQTPTLPSVSGNLIDLAIRAAPDAYGVSMVTGERKVFNITPAGTAPANAPRAPVNTYTNTSSTSQNKVATATSSGAQSSQLASNYARGIL